MSAFCVLPLHHSFTLHACIPLWPHYIVLSIGCFLLFCDHLCLGSETSSLPMVYPHGSHSTGSHAVAAGQALCQIPVYLLQWKAEPNTVCSLCSQFYGLCNVHMSSCGRLKLRMKVIYIRCLSSMSLCWIRTAYFPFRLDG